MSRSTRSPIAPSAPGDGWNGNDRANVVLWTAFAGVCVAVGCWFIAGVHRPGSLDALFALAALLVRTGLFVAVGLWAESLLLRPWGGRPWAGRARRLALHGLWIGVMALTLGVFVDVFVFGFAGYHLTTAINIVFADGLGGVSEAMAATGMPVGRIIGGGAALAAGSAAAVWLSRRTELWSRRWNATIHGWSAFKAALLATGLMALLDTAGYRWRNPFLWELENRRVPLAFSIGRPEAALATFRVALVPPVAVPQPPMPPSASRTGLPDIYLFVIESLRKDMLDPAVMPNFARFAAESWTFDHPVTTGNVTHYSWYGLLCAKYPIYYDAAKVDPRLQGSVPLAALRGLGYQTHLLATPDTAYQQLEAVVFGPGGSLLSTRYHPAAKLPPQRDRMVIDRLLQRLGNLPAGGGFHLVALDSTHFEYGWGEGFQPPFTPYAPGTSVMKNYQRNLAARAAVFNRYKNSAAWMDSLLGEFLDALRAAGRMDNSIVIITGDHGESFWERGVGTHGSDLGPEQTEVAFAMRLPGTKPERFATVFSLLDVMPTILARLGATPDPAAGLAGRPVQDRLADPTAPGFALTFQGWNTRAFAFAITDGARSVLLELDDCDPTLCRRLAVKDVTLAPGAPSLSEKGDAAAYRSLLGEIPRLVDRLPFLRFE